MRTVIINQFSPKRVNYERALGDLEVEPIFLTKDKHVDAYKEMFTHTVGFEDFEHNDSIYSYIVQLHQQEKIDKVVATHEFDLVKAGYIRDYLGVTGQSSESAILFRDKYEMKKRLQSVVKTPAFKRIRHVFDLMKFQEEFGFPFVIKPIDGAGSVGVQIIRGQSAYDELLKKGIGHDLMAETLIVGEMYHVDGLYENGRLLFSHPSIYVNGCLAFQDEKYLASIMLTEDDPMFERLNAETLTVLSHLPTPEHAIAFHAEFFHTPTDDIVLCEIASRVGGGMVPECLELTKGVDILSESIRAQCGAAIDIQPKKALLGGWIILPPKKGKLLSLNQDIPFEWVLDCYIKEGIEGTVFTGSSSSVDSVASMVVEGRSKEEIMDRFDQLSAWFEQNSEWEL
ncbi:ATP-grasp domain-containing protein [Metabacillus iocasae]|uniref:ATP-grasp domain-containing protein n=1 Tax=Priestia iocasae TaxID=2291674 RepID=A0ABS2QS40_9BACI|nr:ATP-grasp domain-containing protein [Metabacillus iocasae]MBM7702280.1 hypothetical protein [Metabacillus iocasae]